MYNQHLRTFVYSAQCNGPNVLDQPMKFHVLYQFHDLFAFVFALAPSRGKKNLACSKMSHGVDLLF